MCYNAPNFIFEQTQTHLFLLLNKFVEIQTDIHILFVDLLLLKCKYNNNHFNLFLFKKICDLKHLIIIVLNYFITINPHTQRMFTKMQPISILTIYSVIFQTISN